MNTHRLPNRSLQLSSFFLFNQFYRQFLEPTPWTARKIDGVAILDAVESQDLEVIKSLQSRLSFAYLSMIEPVFQRLFSYELHTPHASVYSQTLNSPFFQEAKKIKNEWFAILNRIKPNSKRKELNLPKPKLFYLGDEQPLSEIDSFSLNDTVTEGSQPSTEVTRYPCRFGMQSEVTRKRYGTLTPDLEKAFDESRQRILDTSKSSLTPIINDLSIEGFNFVDYLDENTTIFSKPSKQPSAPADRSYNQEFLEFMMHLESPEQPVPENPFEPKVRKLEDYFEDPIETNKTATFGHQVPANSSADTDVDLKDPREMSFAEYLRTIDRDASLI